MHQPTMLIEVLFAMDLVHYVVITLGPGALHSNTREKKKKIPLFVFNEILTSSYLITYPILRRAILNIP